MLKKIEIRTKKRIELVDITDDIQRVIQESGIKSGICTIFTTHTTAGITINENADPNVQADIIKAINKIVPEHDNYLHDSVDNNAAAHIKSSIIGVSKAIPIKDRIIRTINNITSDKFPIK